MIRRLHCYLNYSRFYKHIYLIISISLIHIFWKIIKPIFHKNANPLTSGHFTLDLESLVYAKRTQNLHYSVAFGIAQALWLHYAQCEPQCKARKTKFRV